jgi:hypothetical protein
MPYGKPNGNKQDEIITTATLSATAVADAERRSGVIPQPAGTAVDLNETCSASFHKVLIFRNIGHLLMGIRRGASGISTLTLSSAGHHSLFAVLALRCLLPPASTASSNRGGVLS